MFGISDPQIWVGYILAIGLTIACIAYGIANWHKGNGA